MKCFDGDEVNIDEGVGELDENEGDLDERVLNDMRNKGELLFEHVDEIQGDFGQGEVLTGVDKGSLGHGVDLSGVEMEESPSRVSGVGGVLGWGERVSLIQ